MGTRALAVHPRHSRVLLTCAGHGLLSLCAVFVSAVGVGLPCSKCWCRVCVCVCVCRGNMCAGVCATCACVCVCVRACACPWGVLGCRSRLHGCAWSCARAPLTVRRGAQVRKSRQEGSQEGQEGEEGQKGGKEGQEGCRARGRGGGGVQRGEAGRRRAHRRCQFAPGARACWGIVLPCPRVALPAGRLQAVDGGACARVRQHHWGGRRACTAGAVEGGGEEGLSPPLRRGVPTTVGWGAPSRWGYAHALTGVRLAHFPLPCFVLV